jgi:hypothetical protein
MAGGDETLEAPCRTASTSHCPLARGTSARGRARQFHAPTTGYGSVGI